MRLKCGAILIILATIFLFSCVEKEKQNSEVSLNNETGGAEGKEELPDLADAIAQFSEIARDPDREAFVEDFWRWIFSEAGIPERMGRKIAASALESPAFVMELLLVLQQDIYTYYLVDKQNVIPDGYEPDDLVYLQSGSYSLTRDGMQLRGIAAEALREMAAAAAGEGITLTVGSAYRTAEYQAMLYDRAVRTYGKEAADRESAESGKSQHQLGLAVDFSPIDDEFAKTPASEWLLKNASRFGWSLSYPENYEDITGYRWESWHYRFVGKDLAEFIDTYFEGIQQYALQFIHSWQEISTNPQI